MSVLHYYFPPSHSPLFPLWFLNIYLSCFWIKCVDHLALNLAVLFFNVWQVQSNFFVKYYFYLIILVVPSQLNIELLHRYHLEKWSPIIWKLSFRTTLFFFPMVMNVNFNELKINTWFMYQCFSSVLFLSQPKFSTWARRQLEHKH